MGSYSLALFLWQFGHKNKCIVLGYMGFLLKVLVSNALIEKYSENIMLLEYHIHVHKKYFYISTHGCIAFPKSGVDQNTLVQWRKTIQWKVASDKGLHLFHYMKEYVKQYWYEKWKI